MTMKSFSGEPDFTNNGCSVIELSLGYKPVSTKAFNFSSARFLSVLGDQDDREDLIKVINPNNIQFLSIVITPENGEPFDTLHSVRESICSLELEFTADSMDEVEPPFHAQLVRFLFQLMRSGETFPNLSWMCINLTIDTSHVDDILGLDRNSTEFKVCSDIITKFLDFSDTLPQLKTLYLAASPFFIGGLCSNRLVNLKCSVSEIYEPITGRRMRSDSFNPLYMFERDYN